MPEAVDAASRLSAKAFETVMLTGLSKFLGRPVAVDEAVEMARGGRISCVTTVDRPFDGTYSLDGQPFVFIGAVETWTVADEKASTFHMNLPHRFIGPPT